MLTNDTNVVRYQISGSTYAISFPYWDEDEIKAYITLSDESTTELTLNTDFTVSTPNGVSGTLTKVTAWTDAQQLTIMREVALDQQLDLTNGEKIDAENLEGAFDHAIAGLQQVQEQLDRSVMTSVDEPGTGLTFPNKAARAGTGEGTIMGFDSTGEDIVLRDLAQFDADVSNTATNATNAENSANSASASALVSEGYANGEQNGTPVSSGTYYQNNSKYYSEESAASATASESSAEDSEAWAVGKRGGVDVGSDDETYHNNSKYYLEQVQQTVSGALRYQGTWTTTGATDYSALSTPRLLGDMFYCEGTACTIDSVTYTQGDLIIFNQDVSSGTTITTSMIDKVDNTESVTPDNTCTLTNKTITFADNTMTDVASTNTSQTLTNKTIAYADNTLTGVQPIVDYSTSEVSTGRKWIDGKPIYSKVFSQRLTSYTDNTNRRNFNLDISSFPIDKIINAEGFIIAEASESWLNGVTLPIGACGINGLEMAPRFDTTTEPMNSGFTAPGNEALRITESVSCDNINITAITINIAIYYTKN